MEQLVFTAFLNRLFGPAVLALLLRLGIHPKHPATPISNSFAMELLVAVLLAIFFVAVRARLSVESPGALQHTMEGINGFISDGGRDCAAGMRAADLVLLSLSGIAEQGANRLFENLPGAAG